MVNFFWLCLEKEAITKEKSSKKICVHVSLVVLVVIEFPPHPTSLTFLDRCTFLALSNQMKSHIIGRNGLITVMGFFILAQLMETDQKVPSKKKKWLGKQKRQVFRQGR
jgi:hypothetical protein